MNTLSSRNLVGSLLFTAGFLCTGISPTMANITPTPEVQVVSAVNSKISGIVVDNTGSPIIGASVQVKGTTIGMMTDLDGRFTLNAPAGSVLEISYVGYQKTSIPVGNKTEFKIVLAENAEVLDEVVVVGYGTQKKVNITGAVSTVSSAKLQNRPVTNTSTALQGLLSGVTVIQNSGQPGKDNSSIRIRGIGTLNNANPMYVVDGLTVSTINDIDPNDIENLSILKDAASAAIYGSRAANGVILITTKKGTKKPATIKYDGYAGWQSPTALQEYLPSHEYAKLYNQALLNENKKAMYTDAEIEKFRNGSDPDNYPNTDWLDLLYKKNAFQQSHRAEVSGGFENTTYMFSLGYLDQEGLIAHSDYQRYNTRVNVNTQINKLFANASLSYVFGNVNEPSNPYTGDMYQILRQVNRIAPFVANKYSNGYYGYTNDGNPIEWLDSGSKQQEKTHTFRGVGNVGYEFIKGLKLQQMLGYEYSSYSKEKFIKDSQYYNWKTGAPTLYQGPNNQTDYRRGDMMVNLQTLLTYNNTFGLHTVGAITGYSQEYNRRDWTQAYRKGFLNNDLWEVNAGSPDGQKAEGSAYEYSLQSFFGRVTYDFDNRYLFEANVRRDGTSRIAKQSRWGTFPSFSAAWRVSNEAFMENAQSVISDLKFRAGWGELGNQAMDDPNDPAKSNYPYQSVLSQLNYSFGGKVVQGVGPKYGANSNLKWETSQTTNIGVDMGFLSNMITMNVDGYWRTTRDILLQLPVSTLYGLEAPFQNAGKVRNRGIELQLGYHLAKKDFTFNATLNGSYNDNEILDLRNNGAKIWDGSQFKQEGRPINAFGGYEVLGIFKTKEDLDKSAVINRERAGLGDFKYKDQNNDGKIDGLDRVYLGSSAPKYIFGLNLDGTWNGLDLAVQLSGAAGVKGYLSNETIGRLNGNTSKPTSVFRDSWDANTNPHGKFPRPLSSWMQNDSEANPSSYWIINSSYLRLKNITLGYTLPKQILKQIGIQQIRVYYSAQNLLTITSFNKGFDPEAPVGARAYYPQVKVNTIGLNVTF